MSQYDDDFIFFGCWNNINCDKEYYYRDLVLDYIINNEKQVKKLYLAGDNWYNNIKPPIEGQTNNNIIKTYYKSILDTGYDKIYKMDKDTYIVLGNHDQDKTGDKNCLLNIQKEKIINLKLKSIFEEYTDMIYKDKEKDKKELFDAFKNIFNKINKKHIKLYDDIGYKRCNNYNIIFINTNKIFVSGKDENEKANRYISKLENKIKIVTKGGNNKKIFVIGHHPIVSYKKKGDKEYVILGDIDISKRFYKLLTQYNCIYLCADTHNFQISEISLYNKISEEKISEDKNKLIQIVSGTGGADPDYIEIKDIYNFESNDKIKNDNEEKYYKTKGYAINSYGYTKIGFKANNIIVTYIKLTSSNDKIEKPINNPLIYQYTIDTHNNISQTTIQLNKSITFNDNSYKINKVKECTQKYLNKDDIAKTKDNKICFEKKKKRYKK
jgi:hypothetical protein